MTVVDDVVGETEAINVPVRTSGASKRNDQMTLTECAEFDHRTGQKGKLTGWGIISKDRRERGISRKERRKQRQN